MSASLSIGNELKDSYDLTYKWVSLNLKWLKEIEAFYQQRAKIELEYSEKLKNLAADFSQRTSKSKVALSVGETPTITPGSVEGAVVVTWNQILQQTDLIAKDHDRLANQYQKKIGGQLNDVYARLDFTLTQISGFNTEMDDKKKLAFAELDKAKKRYDESCASMEQTRRKTTKSDSERNCKKMAQKELAMNISKNDYLIRIGQANRTKDKYYFQDVPEVVDLLQDLNESRILFLNDIWRDANSVESEFCELVKDHIVKTDDVIDQNRPSLTTAMFIKHNQKAWVEPKDFQYVPSPIWHEDEKFACPSEEEVQDLRVKLAQAENEYNSLNDATQGELSQLSTYNKIKQTLKSEIEAGKIDARTKDRFYENLKNYLSIVSPFVIHETSKLQAEVTIESIHNNVPEEYDLSIANVNLKEKKRRSGFGLFSRLKNRGSATSMATPTSPTSSQSSIKDTGSRRSVRSSKFFSGLRKHKEASENADTVSEVDSTNVFADDNASRSPSLANSTLARSGSAASASGNGNKVLYAYQQQDTDEISIQPGDSIELVEADTGTGWTKIRNVTSGAVGLVPTSYISITSKATSGSATHAPPRAPPSRRHSSMPKRTMQCVYAYEAQDNDELSIQPGDVVTVIRGDDGSGWTYGEVNGVKGLVPTSYCKSL